MLDISKRTHREMKDAALVCCGPEADLAHKIQKQIAKKRKNAHRQPDVFALI